MKHLLKTDLRRFLTHPLFIGILIMYAVSHVYMLLQLIIINRSRFSIDPMLCIAVIMIQSALLSLLITTQHKEGILRNKIIAGYSRRQIFLSALLAAGVVSLILYTAFLPAALLVAYDPVREIPRHYLITAAVSILLMHLCTAAINVTLSLLIRGRLLSLLIGVSSVALLAYTGVILTDILYYPCRIIREIKELEQEPDPDDYYAYYPTTRVEGDIEYESFPVVKKYGAHWNEEGILVSSDGVPFSHNHKPYDAEDLSRNIEEGLPAEGIYVYRDYYEPGAPRGALRSFLKFLRFANPYAPLIYAADQIDFDPMSDRSPLHTESRAAERKEWNNKIVPHLYALPVLTLLYSIAGVWLFRRKELF